MFASAIPRYRAGTWSWAWAAIPALTLCPMPVRAELPPPVAAYASLPSVARPAISPDGRRIVMLRTVGDTQHAFVTDLDSGSTNPVLGADPSRFLINYCGWGNDERVICSIRSYGEVRSGRAYYRYRDGRTTFTRLIAVDAAGGNQITWSRSP